MAGKLLTFFDDQYQNFLPLWKWKIPQGKKFIYSYNDVLTVCRKAQYFIAAALLVLALFCERSRKAFISASARDGVVLLSMEISTWVFLGYFLGLKRFPANYIPLCIVRTFIVLEKNLKPQVKHFELKVLSESRWQGHWSVLTYNSTGNSFPVESQIRNGGLLLATISAVWILTTFSKIDVSNFEKYALVSTTATTSAAAILLVTSYTLKGNPFLLNLHKAGCELWILFAIATFAFVFTFLFQRLRRVVRGEIKPSHGMRLHWECLIFVITLYIMVRYIPVLHEGFSIRDLLGKTPKRFAKSILPNTIRLSTDIVVAYVYQTGQKVAHVIGGMFDKAFDERNRLSCF